MFSGLAGSSGYGGSLQFHHHIAARGRRGCRENAGIRQMRPNSKFLGDLNRDCGILEQAGFVSIWTRFDLMIVPARSSVLPVGRSIQVGVLAHPLMVNDRRVLRLVEQVLTEPA
jgi:triacylglycerol lipase